MPSLRRTLSTPSVRSAPYPSAMHTPSSTGTRSTHRRSTGSETSLRRVLADLDWWRVTDGQQEVVPEVESEELDLDPDAEDSPDQVAVVPAPTGAGDDGAGRQPTPAAHWALALGTGSLEMPVAEMAALAIAPSTPRRYGHALESSTSSLESTPEAPEVQAEHPFLDLDTLSFGLQRSAPALRRTRSDTYPATLSLLADFAAHERQYADFAISPLSSPPIFSN